MKIKKDKKFGYYHVTYLSSNGDTITRSLKTKSRKEAEKLVKDSNIAKIETAAKVDALTQDSIVSIVAGKNHKIDDVIKGYEKFREMKCHSKHSVYSGGEQYQYVRS